MSDGVTVNEFIRRFEMLKKQYFAPSKVEYDDDGQEIPSAFMSKAQIVEIFEKSMNLELPMHPAEPPIFKGQRKENMYGEWWKAPPTQQKV